MTAGWANAVSPIVQWGVREAANRRSDEGEPHDPGSMGGAGGTGRIVEPDAITRAYQRDFGRMPTDEELNRDLGLAGDLTAPFFRPPQHYRPLPPPGLIENYLAPIFRMFMPAPQPGPNPPMFPGKRG